MPTIINTFDKFIYIQLEEGTILTIENLDNNLDAKVGDKVIIKNKNNHLVVEKSGIKENTKKEYLELPYKKN